ncbi:hypothetical protein CLCR_00539 [Cladophialophora carrionii]|uniref:Uncharacterized protein n=1 Tax=Cladophialophora carrionii TaxID=86049 RepID=A0A1C1CBN3_9EURO|nr:hypothetical protein CLCR_00539 [Cladophialophora carrionii]
MDFRRVLGRFSGFRPYRTLALPQRLSLARRKNLEWRPMRQLKLRGMLNGGVKLERRQRDCNVELQQEEGVY